MTPSPWQNNKDIFFPTSLQTLVFEMQFGTEAKLLASKGDTTPIKHIPFNIPLLATTDLLSVWRYLHCTFCIGGIVTRYV